MTDHIRDSIDQLFPPEPPDDPRPEPPPPPDDALPACPNCGALGRSLNITTDGKWRLGLCDECDFALGIKEWNRLARAVALLRACERLEKTPRHGMEFVITYYESEHGRDSVIDTVQVIYREGHPPARLHYDMVRGDDLADALIALAARLEAGDA